jgi:A/G-specific adenine glycosylase
VLVWGIPRLRDRPWWRTRDPWLVLVSEVMLQQTQARRVIPKWESSCAAYPNPRACAAAPLGEVVESLVRDGLVVERFGRLSLP